MKNSYDKQPDKISSDKDYKWSNYYTSCRICASTSNHHYGNGYCEQCYSNSLEFKVKEGYTNGENLSEVGRRLGFSRERASKLYKRACMIEVVRQEEDLPEKEILDNLKTIHKTNRSIKEFKQLIEKKYDEINKIVKTRSIKNLGTLLSLVGLPLRAKYIFDAEYPEIIDMISKNKLQWSNNYEECRECKTKEIPHKYWGYCKKCYFHTELWKKRQSKYYISHIDEIREKQKAYGIKYRKLPHIRKQHTQKSYIKRYDGNREAAIVLAGNKCLDCGISRVSHKSNYAQDLSVLHSDGELKNNQLANLIALCTKCRARRVIFKHTPWKP
jgi:Zn finger protein HypA/HybF involved in hydrogenase expression